MPKRTGGPQFTTSSRAIVLPSRDELPEEFCTMPNFMIGRTKVDGVMNALRTLLETAGATVEGHNHRQFKASFEGKTVFLPVNFAGDATKQVIRERLAELNLQEALDALDTEAAEVITKGLRKGGFKDTTPPPGEFLGIAMTEGTAYLADQFAGSLRADLDAEIERKVQEQSDAGNWQQIAEETERRMQVIKRERDEAVRVMANERDQALADAKAARTELDGVRKSLAGLAPLFQKES